jgi:glycerophosphoryl diester phosphodiesterase
MNFKYKALIFITLILIILGLLLDQPISNSLGYELVESIMNPEIDNTRFVKLIILLTLLAAIATALSIYIANLLNLSALKLSAILILILVMLLLLGYYNKITVGINTFNYLNSQSKREVSHKDRSFICNINRLIAHAGGDINDDTYTDSLESINLSYKKKFRLFELDILKTIDGKYVAAHDWHSWKIGSNYKGAIPPTHKDFMSHKIKNKYTPLDMESINSWFTTHSDATLVTDKVNNPKEFSKKFVDNERLIMELFTMESVIEGVKNKVNVMPSWKLVRLIRNNKLETLQSLGIQYITANKKNLTDNKDLFMELASNDIKIYLWGNYNETIMPEYYYGRYANDQNFINKCSK